MSLSIRWRLTAWIAIALAVTLAAVLVSLRFTVSRVMTDDLDDRLASDAGQVTAQVAIASSFDDPGLVSIVNSGTAYPVVIRDVDGEVLAASAGLGPDVVALSAEERRRILGEGEALTETVDIRGDDVRVRSFRLVIGREVVGIGQVGESAEAIDRVLNALTLILLGGGLAAIVLALAAGYWLARSALRPIEGMTGLAAEIEASDLTRRIGARGEPAEVQRLAETFDAMLARLDAAFRQQRDFVLDVSHELRTPLTALRGNLDVLLMDESLSDDTREQLERMSTEVARLIRMTSNLLYMAHADAGRELVRRPVDLDELCTEVLREFRNLRPDVELTMSNREQVSLPGDRDLLKQLLLNLVDNGLKYTPDGGSVTVSLFRDEGQARVVVEDDGPGIPASQIDSIFDRFYRGDDSGARSPRGAGIGLAISRWIALAHRGDITVESEAGEGSAFTVTLPLDGDSGEAGPPGEAAATPPGLAAAGGTEER